MADLRSVLAKYGLNEDAITEIEEAATPDSFRKQLSELGAKAKRADELEAQLGSIQKAPKREALASRFGVDLSSLKKAERHALEQFDWEGDEPSEEAFAQHLSEWEIPTQGRPEQQEQQPSGAARIVDHAVSSGQAQPPSMDSDFHKELEAAETAEDADLVLAKYGRLETAN